MLHQSTFEEEYGIIRDHFDQFLRSIEILEVMVVLGVFKRLACDRNVQILMLTATGSFDILKEMQKNSSNSTSDDVKICIIQYRRIQANSGQNEE